MSKKNRKLKNCQGFFFTDLKENPADKLYNQILNYFFFISRYYFSEQDLQFSLANFLYSKKSILNIDSIFFEVPIPKEYTGNIKTMQIDLIIKHLGGNYSLIELKYKKEKVSFHFDLFQSSTIQYELHKDGAMNIGCHSFLSDLCRLEKLIYTEKFNISNSYTIFLTNDKSYTIEPVSNKVDYYDFSIHHTRKITSNVPLKWLNEKKNDSLLFYKDYDIYWFKSKNMDYYFTILKVV